MNATLRNGLDHLFQWDRSQFVDVSRDVKRIDFTFRENPDVCYGVFNKGAREIKIPNVLLQKSGVLDALIMYEDSKGIGTFQRWEIPVLERPMPPGYLVTEDGEFVSYTELESLIAQMQFLSTKGGTMSGDIDMNKRAIHGLVDPVEDDEPTRKRWTEATYLHKDGGEVSGRITGFQDPVQGSEPATKGYMDDALEAADKKLTSALTAATNAMKEKVDGMRKVFSATISTEWVGESEPYTQEVAVEGILASDIPHVGPVYSDDAKTAAAQKEAWGYVDMGISDDGKITFTCIEGKPETEIPIQIEVMR